MNTWSSSTCIHILGRSLSNVICAGRFCDGEDISQFINLRTQEKVSLNVIFVGMLFHRKDTCNVTFLHIQVKSILDVTLVAKCFLIMVTLTITFVHTWGEKPFKCNVCRKSFSMKNKLKYRMLVHMQK